ncbi:hypothetical protein [Vannielia litorea]|uniref:hypothetical protein n=1 Tax=Vannielia litorea TaxID=1217970 RepID=UPI001C9485EF|nr:hypothetical protein [Vannielia litorea]MBY6049159.1 hypothetical protein [Vannielia litorea]MBY6076573.1 hypothetical protein [Vannielia litorea]
MKPLASISAAAVAFTAALAPALPANALSCLRPDPVQLYTQARDSDGRFRIVHGTLTAQETIRKRRQTGSDRLNPKPVHVKARLQGMQLGKGGFSTPIDAAVTVTLECFASWCGGWPGSDQMLMAVEETKGGGLTVFSDPCSSKIYPKPTSAELRRVLTCHKGGSCPTEMR